MATGRTSQKICSNVKIWVSEERNGRWVWYTFSQGTTVKRGWSLLKSSRRKFQWTTENELISQRGVTPNYF